MVFLVRAISTEPSGAMAPRKAWGMITSRMDWPKVRPMARAASAWPRSTVLTPDRRASQTKAAW